MPKQNTVTLTKDMVDVAIRYHEICKEDLRSNVPGCVLSQLGMAVLGTPVISGFDVCISEGDTACYIKGSAKLVSAYMSQNWDKLYSYVGASFEYTIRKLA